MKLLILSDSHRNIQNMVQAVRLEEPDLMIHLGDHYQDAMELKRLFSDIPLEAVAGNCDFGQKPSEKLITVHKKQIFLCHGHNQHVKCGLLNLEYAAREKQADIVLFGHTHRIFCEQHNQLAILNPGSIGDPRYPGRPSYGLVFIEEDSIFLQTQFLSL